MTKDKTEELYDKYFKGDDWMDKFTKLTRGHNLPTYHSESYCPPVLITTEGSDLRVLNIRHIPISLDYAEVERKIAREFFRANALMRATSPFIDMEGPRRIRGHTADDIIMDSFGWDHGYSMGCQVPPPKWLRHVDPYSPGVLAGVLIDRIKSMPFNEPPDLGHCYYSNIEELHGQLTRIYPMSRVVPKSTTLGLTKEEMKLLVSPEIVPIEEKPKGNRKERRIAASKSRRK